MSWVRNVLGPKCPYTVRSRHEQQRLGKLGCRRSKAVCDGQSVMMIALSKDDLEVHVCLAVEL